jgi:HEAT repeat protein
MNHPSSSANPALDPAFAHLETYATGSGRAGLVPIDQAAGASLADPALRSHLEQRLLTQLARPNSTEAGTYICDKLRLIGSSAAVPVLARLLTDPALGDVARGTLEALPAMEVSGALRRALPKMDGPGKIGVVHALGRQQDPENVPVLARLMNDPDLAVAAAAAAALGTLGTPRATEVLQRFLVNPPTGLRLAIAHATLDCAAALSQTGHRSEAMALYRGLTGSEWPEIIVVAARRALAAPDARSQ